MSGDYTQRTSKALAGVQVGVPVGSDLHIYDYIVVYIVVIEVMKKLLNFLDQKKYI